jgi:hypothetical protein
MESAEKPTSSYRTVYLAALLVPWMPAAAAENKRREGCC